MGRNIILDKIDKTLLKELEKNARQGYKTIAKKLRISKDTVRYRVKKLEKIGIIKGYYSLLNIAKMGYLTYKFVVSFRNTTPQVEQRIIEFLTNAKEVGWLATTEGPYHLTGVTWVKDPGQFSRFFKGFLEKFSSFIGQREVLMITENHASRKSYLFDSETDEFPDQYYSVQQPPLNLDSKDFLILRTLANNARISLKELSKVVGITAEAVAYRIKKLKRAGVIQAFRPILDTSLLGFEYYNILFKLKSFRLKDRMFRWFKTHPNIIYFVEYLGSYDIGIDVEVKNRNELRNIINSIKKHFHNSIETYHSLLVYKEHKLSYFPPS